MNRRVVVLVGLLVGAATLYSVLALLRTPTETVDVEPRPTASRVDASPRPAESTPEPPRELPPPVSAKPTSPPAQGVPEPKFDRIDYAHPEKYLDLPASLGKRATIEGAAAQITGATYRQKLASIGAWIDTHLRYDDHAAYAWRDFDKILADGTFGGCADHAEIFGALSRACGVPTVWVKTMDSDWIRNFRRTHDENATWSGHVFLEVYVDGQWSLLNATQGLLQPDYDVRQRILPGSRFAYDKGGDPYEVVLSTRWEDWKEQTRRHFRDFDVAQLPVEDGGPLRPAVYVVANNPEWTWTVQRCHALGFQTGESGNCKFEKWMPKARGQFLVVTSLAGKVVLPDAYKPLLPSDALRAAVAARPSGVVSKTADDGTRVVVVFARDSEALHGEIEKLTLND